jgi:hypothetical protein
MKKFCTSGLADLKKINFYQRSEPVRITKVKILKVFEFCNWKLVQLAHSVGAPTRNKAGLILVHYMCRKFVGLSPLTNGASNPLAARVQATPKQVINGVNLSGFLRACLCMSIVQLVDDNDFWASRKSRTLNHRCTR